MSAHFPEAHEPGRQLHERPGLIVRCEPGQRRAEVVVLTFERKPVDVGLRAKLAFDPVGSREEVLGVSSPDLLGLAACFEQFERVRADALQHREAGLAVGLLFLTEQVVVDQRREAGQGRGAAAHCLHRLEGAAAHEDGQAHKQGALVPSE